MFYKCVNCGGNVVYSPEKHTMHCPYCDSEKSEECVKGTKEIDTTTGEEIHITPSAEVSNEETVDNSVVKEENVSLVCANCGGGIALEHFTSATQCPYCGSFHIIDRKVEGEYEPKKIIPFMLGKEACKEAIKNRCKKVTFAPGDLLSEARLDSVQGMYVPYWMYNYDTNAVFSGEGTKVRTWIAGSTEYTETSIYSIERDMDISYREVPADASIQMPDDIMDLIEPFEYKDFVPFSPTYMSGFQGEVYNMPSADIGYRALEKIRNSAQAILSGSYSGYTGVKTLNSSISLGSESANYNLLPVWIYDYSYKGEKYPFYVNGQTGKVVGLAPLSKKKAFFYSFTVFAITALIIMFVLMLLFM